jgi:hypothetical protein
VLTGYGPRQVQVLTDPLRVTLGPIIGAALTNLEAGKIWSLAFQLHCFVKLIWSTDFQTYEKQLTRWNTCIAVYLNILTLQIPLVPLIG